jgi:hypothetical protein
MVFAEDVDGNEGPGAFGCFFDNEDDELPVEFKPALSRSFP